MVSVRQKQSYTLLNESATTAGADSVDSRNLRTTSDQSKDMQYVDITLSRVLLPF